MLIDQVLFVLEFKVGEIEYTSSALDQVYDYAPDLKNFHETSQSYQKNAYRVLLTRARQGMVIVVPAGDPADPTRRAEFYDPTFAYLEQIGFPTI